MNKNLLLFALITAGGALAVNKIATGRFVPMCNFQWHARSAIVEYVEEHCKCNLDDTDERGLRMWFSTAASATDKVRSECVSSNEMKDKLTARVCDAAAEVAFFRYTPHTPDEEGFTGK